MPHPEALVIDDDEDMNRMMGAYAQLSGFKYRSATTGQGGLDEVRRSAPAVVLLDVMLPDVDGFEVCRQLKSDARTRGVPVILITALTDPESRGRGTKAGADDYLAKPFDPDQLMKSVMAFGRPRQSKSG
jgi:DNA-binding response OmpR family regulator